MDKKKQIKRLKEHILALNKGYDNIIEILSEDIEKKQDDDGNDVIALKDDKIKIFADGVLKSAETADAILDKIQVKETQLEELQKPEEPTTEVVKDNQKIESNGDSKLSKRLN